MKATSPSVLFGTIAGLASASFLAVSAPAADLNVAQGDSQTITTNATYDALVVNGNLTIAPNVTVSCATLTVADNINGTATLTVGDGATLQVTGTDWGHVKIGVGTGRAEMTLGTGATFSATFVAFCFGHTSAQASGVPMTEALLVVGPNATVNCRKAFYFGQRWNSSSDYLPSGFNRGSVNAVVRLDAGAELRTSQIVDRLSASEKILFNGGRVVGSSDASPYTDGGGFIKTETPAAKWTDMYLEGTNGCPISFHLPISSSYTSFISLGSASCHIHLRGDGGFAKTGAGVLPFVSTDHDWSANEYNVRFLFSGDMVIEEGGFSVATAVADTVFRAAANNLSRPIDLVVGNAGTFDLAGCNVVLNSITAEGGGLVTNSAAGTTTMTLDGRDGSRPTTLLRDFPGISVVKQGASAFTLCGETVEELNLQAGSLAFKGRKVLGYPFYRILFDEIKAGRDGSTALIVREFAWMNDGVDVTRPYAKVHYNLTGSSYVNSPESLFDNNFADEGDYKGYGYYYDPRAGHTDEWKRPLIGATVEYDTCHPVDGYRWAPVCFWKSDNTDNRDPAAWRVFGGFSATTDASDLTLLDQVTGFRVTTVTSDKWNTTNFVCTYAPTTTTVGSLTLASGVPLSVDGAAVTATTLATASAVPVTLSHDATLTLPAATEVASLSVDVDAGGGTLTNFRPASGGAVYLTGNVTRPRKCVLPVQVGTLLGSGLSSWRVYVDGVEVDQTEVIVREDGFLQTQYTGATVLYVR